VSVSPCLRGGGWTGSRVKSATPMPAAREPADVAPITVARLLQYTRDGVGERR
jgi:hypothetical protein